jgi:hypothetical protein
MYNTMQSVTMCLTELVTLHILVVYTSLTTDCFVLAQITAVTVDVTVTCVCMCTGVGKHSKQPYVPVLRPGVIGMLLEEQEPPLQAYYAQGNAGRSVS